MTDDVRTALVLARAALRQLFHAGGAAHEGWQSIGGPRDAMEAIEIVLASKDNNQTALG